MCAGSAIVSRRLAGAWLLVVAVAAVMSAPVVDAQVAAPVGQVTLLRIGLDPGSVPYRIASSPDGTLWFTDVANGKVGQVALDGRISEQKPPGAAFGYAPFVVGYDGNMWFAGDTNGVVRMRMDGHVTVFRTPGIRVGAVAASADGNIWFTDLQNHAIGRLTPEGRITEFTFGLASGSRPTNIAAGPNDTMWFTDTACPWYGQCAIGVISTRTARITEFPSSPSRPLGSPGVIAAGPDGNMWFADLSSRPAIGRITPGGQITEFSAGVSNLVAGAVVAGPDGNIWFSDYGDKTIGRITPQGFITEFSSDVTTYGDYPWGLAVAADGNLWFTVSNNTWVNPGPSRTGAIGRIGIGGTEASTARPRLLGPGRVGSVETCGSAQWSTWAGRAPSLGLLPSDGYKWLRDGIQLPVRGPAYVPTPADAGHDLVCAVTATYPPPFMVSATAFSVTTPITAAVPPPAISRLRVIPRAFTVSGRLVHGRCVSATPRNRAHRGCTRPVILTVQYTLTSAARVTFTLRQQTVGRLIGTSCVPATAKSGTLPRCRMVLPLRGNVIGDGRAGTNRFVLHGWSGRRTLPPGAYWLTATPVAVGQVGVPRTTPFRVTR